MKELLFAAAFIVAAIALFCILQGNVTLEDARSAVEQVGDSAAALCSSLIDDPVCLNR